MKNFRLLIEYDGSAYHGWQRQKADTTIQGEIESAVAGLTGKPITLIGSGRTDAGVHARGQVANFHSETRLPSGTIQRGLNALLPDDIVILECREVPDAFHARFDTKSKTYCYSILNRLVPAAIGRQYAWHIPQRLDKDAMRSALRHIVGVHDFKAFEGAGSQQLSTVRHMMRADLIEKPNGRIEFLFTADGFLKHMVRNIVGTVVDVGRGRILADAVPGIRDSADRSLAGATAPGHGLCLMEVCYDDEPRG